jgi:two-component system chemotaxis sensor kinase CheA
VRNVVDHAIEIPEDRVARGVSEAGHLTLRAELTRSHVLVFVEDDGRGIDPDKIRGKAVEKGVMTQAQADALSDQEAVELVFHPGFSTVEKVSELSGRGVGMDVVRTTIQDHGGQVYVESQVGVGTTFRMEIPLRSAVMVIDGLMVQQAEQNFVVPFEHILEITEVSLDAVNYVGGDLMVNIRGNSHHAVSLGDVLDLAGLDEDAKTVQAVLVGGKFGSLCLLVEQVHGHRQVVVNNIEDVLPDVDGVAGVAQLGGGRLALVVNVPEIVNRLHTATV